MLQNPLEKKDELFTVTDKLWATSLIGSCQSALSASSVNTYADKCCMENLNGSRSLDLDCRYGMQIIYY